MLMRHGVRSCLEYARSGDLAAAKALSQSGPLAASEFVDMGGHGYATVRLSAGEMTHRVRLHSPPFTGQRQPDGGPLRYRVRHSAQPVAGGRAAAAYAARRRGRSRAFDLADNAAPPERAMRSVS